MSASAPSSRPTAPATLALAGIMAVWGSSFPLLRLLLGGAGTASAATPLVLIALRMGLASVLLFAFLIARPAGRAQLSALLAPRQGAPFGRGSLLRDGLVCGLLLGSGFVLQIEGLQRTTASRSGFLTGLLVVLVPLWEFVLFRRRPSPVVLGGAILAFLGLALLSAPWLENAGSTSAGDLLTVGCAAVFAVHILVLGRVAQRHPLLPLLLLQLACVGLLCALLGPFVEVQRFAGGPRVWLGLAYLAVFCTLLAFGVQTWAQQRLPPVRVAVLSSLEPVFAALWSALFLGERLSRHELAGGALIVFGVAAGEIGSALRGGGPTPVAEPAAAPPRGPDPSSGVGKSG